VVGATLDMSVGICAAMTAIECGRALYRLTTLAQTSPTTQIRPASTTPGAFTAPTALWLAFAGGLAVLLVSLRALALHEATVERVVHSLELNGSGHPVAARPSQPAAGTPFARLRDELEISGQMRSWADWLAYTAVGLAGTFVVLTTFAWRHPMPAVDPRWVWFGIGVIAAAIALAVLLEQALAAYDEGINAAWAAELAITITAVGVAGALAVTMALHASIDYRWTAFGLGAGLVGVSLAASLIHELTHLADGRITTVGLRAERVT
jgi:hypothetical protein